ncbi:hypothetical protein AAFF_G00023490 [Aldrovandia affinis]|uniref:Endonuclease/exonuclease/phosphatase domain-containing protein n=1 Tax=Aldrovandia affinis TaxID=143900 RepID=A0AAD7T5P9_9TELE|nr:hypothetical protein AAFF_G00023490 [Aldrovandia affinis]
MVILTDLKGNKRDLPDNIQAAQGARVMVTRDLDIEDGIVNGTFGTIANIVTTTQYGPTTVKQIGLELDNPTAGQKFRRKIQALTVVHHNAERLPTHIEDLKSHHELRLADVLCITETHLSGSFVSPKFQLEGYDMFVCNRHVSYANRVDMATKDGGGVAVYCRSSLQAETRRYFRNVTDLNFQS